MINILSMRLDSWFLKAGEPRVTFVKIDTEGHEVTCIRGTPLLLERCLPSLCSSDLDDPCSDGWWIERELAARDYETYIWTGVSRRPHHKGEHRTNYFFLRRGHLLIGSTAA